MVTGKMIHEAFSIATSDVNRTLDWSEITEQARARYEIMAMHLNEQDEEPSCSEQEYISEVLRTCAAAGFDERLLLGGLGLAGESGEVVDLVKKARFQGHTIDVEKVKDELGDVMWYLALLCHTFGFSLEEIRQANVAKMHRRYPNGFEVERSVNR